MQIFISHSSADADTAIKICELLERHKTPCFIAPRDIRSGKEYAEELLNGIDRSTAMILLMSENANHSPHVLREVERAVSKSIPILVYKLEEVSLTKSMEYFLMTHQWINAKSDETQVDLLRFADDLKHSESIAANDLTDAGSTIRKTASPHTDSVAETTESPVTNYRRKSTGNRHFLLPAGLLLIALIMAAGIFAVIHNKRNPAITPVAIGDTVTFGSYNGEPIEWRVLKLSDDKKQAVLISSRVLTMKAYDAPEGGRFNWYESTDYWSKDSEADTDLDLQILVRGNNDWSSSNIRTWLNCADEVVTYTDQPPYATAMAERKNGYQNEAGFLHGFTDEELAAITETANVTKHNPLFDSDTVTTTDRVYLLSLDELQWFDGAKISKFALPTQAAVDQDESFWYQLDYNEFNIKECSWWLREPVEGTSSKCYLVGNGYTGELLRRENAGLEGFGIRPALTVDLRKAVFSNDKPEN